jgi:hypothetical protein
MGNDSWNPLLAALAMPILWPFYLGAALLLWWVF